MKKYVFAAAAFLTINASAGPLGLSKGMTLEQVKQQATLMPTDSPYGYTTTKLANGHPDFETYALIITPQQGLCKIHAMSADIPTSVYGTELQTRYKSLSKAMVEKYGKPEGDHDFLRAGSLWKESKYWMMGLQKNERLLATYWGPPKNVKLPDSLSTMKVEARAISQNKGFLLLNYEFDNYDACAAVLKAKKNANL